MVGDGYSCWLLFSSPFLVFKISHNLLTTSCIVQYTVRRAGIEGSERRRAVEGYVGVHDGRDETF